MAVIGPAERPLQESLTWRRFRETHPDVSRARGYWNDPIQLPTVRGAQIGRSLRLLDRAPRRMPELLLKSPVSLRNRFTLWAFCEEDLQVVNLLKVRLDRHALAARIHVLSEYASLSEPTRAWRAAIADYFSGRSPFPADLNFDRQRRRNCRLKKNSVQASRITNDKSAFQ